MNQPFILQGVVVQTSINFLPIDPWKPPMQAHQPRYSKTWCSCWIKYNVWKFSYNMFYQDSKSYVMHIWKSQIMYVYIHTYLNYIVSVWVRNISPEVFLTHWLKINDIGVDGGLCKNLWQTQTGLFPASGEGPTKLSIIFDKYVCIYIYICLCSASWWFQPNSKMKNMLVKMDHLTR